MVRNVHGPRIKVQVVAHFHFAMFSVDLLFFVRFGESGIVKMASITPAPHGQRQLHHTLDYLATKTPDRLYAAIPKTTDLADGFRDISVKDMARCSDVAAQWIEENLGRSVTFDTLCYIGIPDLRSVAIFFGAVKCGYKVCVWLVLRTPSDVFRFFSLRRAIPRRQMHHFLRRHLAKSSFTPQKSPQS